MNTYIKPVHRYGFIALLLVTISLPAWAAIASPSFTLAHVSGRQVRVTITRVRVPDQTVHYDIYRDGHLIGTAIDGESDPETEGQVWYTSGSYLYYLDNYGIPGKTHMYSVVARTGEDESSSYEREVKLSPPNLSSFAATHVSGRQVRLQWSQIKGTNYQLEYDVYRDDELVGSFPGNEDGEGENGDRWEVIGSTQYYYDVTAIPGKANNYRLVARLFDECEFEISRAINVPAPNMTSFATTYVSGRQVRLQWSQIKGTNYQLEYDVYRDDELVGTFPGNEDGEGENGDRWDTTGSTHYYYDITAVPGKDNNYRLVARLFDGCEFEASRKVSIPTPYLAFSSSYLGGRQIRFQWLPITGIGYSVKYTIIRDGLQIATIDVDLDGENEVASWYEYGSYLYFLDKKAEPGKPNHYSFTANLFDDFSIQTTVTNISIPAPECPRSVTVTMSNDSTNRLTWTNPRDFDADSKINIYRNGELLSCLDASDKGVLPTTYTDDTVNNLEESYTYQLQTVYYDECESDLSPGVTAKYPAFIPRVSGTGGERTVLLSWNTGSVFGNPCRYTIYRDGHRIGESEASTYVDTGLEPGRLYHYTVFTSINDLWKFDGSNTVSVHTTLTTGSLAAVISPLSSLVSPIWLEGESAITGTEVTARIGARQVEVVTSGATSWYINDPSVAGPRGIVLNPKADIGLTLRSKSGDQEQTGHLSLTWVPLDIAAWDPANLPLILRKGDSLLLTVSGSGTASIIIDGGNASTLMGMAGEHFVQQFMDPGEYTISGYVDGVLSGKVDIVVISVEPESGHTYLNTLLRDTVSIQMRPPSAFDNGRVLSTVKSNDGMISISQSDSGGGRNYSIAFARNAHDAGAITNRINAPRGPVISELDITGVACEFHTNAYFPVIQRFSTGEYMLGATVKMDPVIDTAVYSITCQASGVIFADTGLPAMTVTGEDFGANGMLNIYLIAPATFNPETANINVTISTVSK